MELGLVRNESGHPTEWVSPFQVGLQGTIRTPIKDPATSCPVHLPVVSASTRLLPLVKWVSPIQWDHVLLYNSSLSSCCRCWQEGEYWEGVYCVRRQQYLTEMSNSMPSSYGWSHYSNRDRVSSQGSELYKYVCMSGVGRQLCVTLMGFFLKTAISKVYQPLVLFLYWFCPICAIFM